MSRFDTFKHEALIGTLSLALETSPFVVRAKTRTKGVARDRQCVMWALRKKGLSFPEIGHAVRRDHSTVQYGVKNFQRALDEGQGWAVSRVRSVAQHMEAVGGG